MKMPSLIVRCMLPWLVFLPAPAGAGPPSDEDLQARVEATYALFQRHLVNNYDPEAYDAGLAELLADINIDELTARQLTIILPLVQDADAQAWQAVRRLRDLANDKGVDGAIAAVAYLQLNYSFRVEELEVSLKRALAHPALGEAFRVGQGGFVLSSVKYAPEETVKRLKDEVLALSLLFSDDLPPEFVPYVGEYFAGIAKLGDAVDDEVRERIRARVVELCDGALRKAIENDEPDLANRLRQFLTFVESRAARGDLLDRPAPELTFAWFKGGESVASLGDLKGSVVVLDFWATWCGPCIAAFPDLRRLQTRYEDYDVQIIGATWLSGKHYERGRPVIDTRGDPAKEYALMAEFMAKQNMTWPVAFAAGEAAQSYGLIMTGIPHVTILDGNGIVRYDRLDVGIPLEEKIRIIDSLLAEAGLPAPSPGFEKTDETAK